MICCCLRHPAAGGKVQPAVHNNKDEVLEWSVQQQQQQHEACCYLHYRRDHQNLVLQQAAICHSKRTAHSRGWHCLLSAFKPLCCCIHRSCLNEQGQRITEISMAFCALFRASGISRKESPSGWADMICSVPGLAYLVCRQDVLQLGAILLPHACAAKLGARIIHCMVQRRDPHRHNYLQYATHVTSQM